MSDTTTLHSARRAHTVPTHPSVRRHRRDVATWALAHGHVVHRDALAVIVASRVDSSGRISFRWTARNVALVLWSGARSWCDRHGAAPPPDLAATLATYLRYVSAHRLLDPGSDSPASLRRAVAEHRGPEARSRSNHPTAGVRRAATVLPLGTG